MDYQIIYPLKIVVRYIILLLFFPASYRCIHFHSTMSFVFIIVVMMTTKTNIKYPITIMPVTRKASRKDDVVYQGQNREF